MYDSLTKPAKHHVHIIAPGSLQRNGYSIACVLYRLAEKLSDA